MHDPPPFPSPPLFALLLSVYRARALQKNQWPRSPTLPPQQPALEGRGSGAKRKHSVDPSEDELFARSNGGLRLCIFAREAAREEVREGRTDSGVMRVRF
jgi:hypothetical protein